MAAVAQQPISIGIDANNDIFKSYNGGIISSPDCTTNLDHAVLLVGYGSEDGNDYWTVKNSWGPDWGEDGYFRIARDASQDGPGICGLQMNPTYPTM